VFILSVTRRLTQRAITLTVSLIAIVVLTAVILSLTGYDEKVYKAIIDGEKRVYQQQLQRMGVSAEEITRRVREYEKTLISLYGLDQPPVVRAFMNVRNIMFLNLGYAQSADTCSVAGLPFPCRVSDAIMAVIPRSILLVTLAEFVCVVIVLQIGPLLAYKRGGILDKTVISYAAIFNAIPLWWLAMLFILIFAYTLGLAPSTSRPIVAAINSLNIVEIVKYMWLPLLVSVVGLLGGWLYSVRAMVLRVSAEDFVVTAKAKGLSDADVARKHVLRASMPPVITSIVLALSTSIFGGYMITEAVFDWPGMGTLFRVAITNSDSPTVLGLVFMSSLAYVIARFILEILYMILDPRVRI